MVHLTPPLLLAIRDFRWHLSAGCSVKEAARLYLTAHDDEFARKLRENLILKEQGTLTNNENPFVNPYHRALWDLIERGQQGHPILEPLIQLQDEVDRVAAADLESHTATLPFKALLPVMFLQFPAFLILLLVPLLREWSL